MNGQAGAIQDVSRNLSRKENRRGEFSHLLPSSVHTLDEGLRSSLQLKQWMQLEEKPWTPEETCKVVIGTVHVTKILLDGGTCASKTSHRAWGWGTPQNLKELLHSLHEPAMSQQHGARKRDLEELPK